MIRRPLLVFAFLLSTVSLGNAQHERPFVRHPAVSPDGSQIAFSYQGDLWTVPVTGGRAFRLTVHEAYDARPRWSPDGTQLAFVSDRYGNDDLFVMSAAGSTPRRLTHHSTDDLLSDWTSDGRLLFTTTRTFVQVEREDEIYHVRPDGGTPDRALDVLGYAPTLSPDGRLIAFERGSNGTLRKGYRGPAGKEIWTYDTETDSYTQVTNFDGNDYAPAWGGDRTLYFISERGGTYNLYRLALNDQGQATSDPEQLTFFDGDGVRYVTVSADGSTAVFERQTDVYVLNTDGGDPRLLDITVPADYRFDPVERKTYTDDASDYAVSPNGTYVAFVVRGELFLIRNDEESERTVRLTDHPYRDRDMAWLDDETLIFASDREGQYDLYRLESADPDQPDLYKSLRHRAVRLTETPDDERLPIVSPNGDQVTFRRGRGRLVVAQLADGMLDDERVLLDGWATPSDVAWSPDGQWLAYSLPDLTFNHEIYIHAADDKREPVNVSQHPRPDHSPIWSPDGTKLGFISSRSSGDDDVWFAWLREEDWEKTQKDWKELSAEEASGEADEASEDEEPEEQPVEIDFERIHERLEQVTALPGNEAELAISDDGETFYFVANRSGRTQRYEAEVDLYTIMWDGSEQKRLTEGGQSPSAVRLGPEGTHLFMMRSGGHLARLQTSDGSQEALAFSARMTIDHEDEQAQMFQEAWRTLANGFYDPDFHDTDWKDMREKYRPWAMKASTKRDFRDVFNMMLGELNASHLGFYGSDRAETQTEQTGLLGVEMDPVDDGVRVERVVPDSPADRETSKLAAGDVIVAVNGESVAEAGNFYQLLTDRAEELTPLTVRNENGETREVTIRPTNSLRQALYDEWVEERRRLTNEYSDGRLGYIHIQGMNWSSFERFERELVASGADKDGLLVDVRFNGGGWTTDYLLTVLTVRQHAYTIPRGAAEDLDEERTDFRPYYPFGERLPFASWTLPVAALCNQNSFSNAEIFSHAFKNLNLGPLIGTPTFGAVISTGGTRLIDGSFVRLPFRGWFVRTDDTNMENGPAVPDVLVENAPDSKARGVDEQLQAAVRTLLQQIDSGQQEAQRRDTRSPSEHVQGRDEK